MKSVSSELNPKVNLSRRDLILLAALVLFSLCIYMLACVLTFRPGFPLDDAWIHQTYARNLARLGEWSFIPGQTSAGSTSPLWTVLLSVGFFSGLSPLVWACTLGAVLLFGISVQVEVIIRRTIRAYRPALPWAGAMIALEWHMAWAAFSGMETILYIYLVMLLMGLLLTGSRNYVFAGILAGVAAWVRPDGITLLAPIGLAILLAEDAPVLRWNRFFRLAFGFAIFFFPYILFNLMISGTPLPNTFYAKQAEYANWQVTPWGQRSLYFSLQFFQGISLILAPGFILSLVYSIRRRSWINLFVTGWMTGYIYLYLSRLPVYQHGRYLMPALGVFLLLGLCGFFEGFFNASATLRKVLAVVVAFVLLATFGFGVYTYARDVAFIESQMVDTATWVDANIPVTQKIAAHDIGALGFFSRHQIVDLAGLITPEIIPFMNDDRSLIEYLNSSQVNYLVAFSDWKPVLSAHANPVFRAEIAPGLIGNAGNMTVFSWNLP